MATSTNKEQYILELETIQTEIIQQLKTYQKTKLDLYSLQRKFIITNNKAIKDLSNNLYTYKETTDTQENCKNICVNDLAVSYTHLTLPTKRIV